MNLSIFVIVPLLMLLGLWLARNDNVYDPCGEKHIRGTNQKHGKNFQRKFVF